MQFEVCAAIAATENPPRPTVVSVNTMRAKERLVIKKQQEIDAAEKSLSHFEKLASQLKLYGKSETLVMLNNITGKPPEALLIDSERCENCPDNLLLQDPLTHLNTCNICGRCMTRLFVTEDSSSDILILRSGVSGTNINARKRKAGISVTYLKDAVSKKRLLSQLADKSKKNLVIIGSTEHDNVDEAQNDQTDAVEKTYVSYNRFINQFLDTRPEIPERVMGLIYNQLSTIHLLSSVRCRSTPVTSILRAAGETDWLPFSTVISREFNGQCSPRLTQLTIDNIIARFKVITSVTTDKQRKSLGIDMLTSICLQAEGLEAAASCFVLMKTKAVLRLSGKRLMEAIDMAKLKNPKIDWSKVRSLC